MMEVQVDHAAVVTADRAAPAGLLDQDPLDLLEASGHGLTGAPLAAPAVPALALAREMELDEAVMPAHPKLGGALLCGRTTALLQQRYWRFRGHEHMFALTPDASPRP
jgi:hypothetical protein